MPSAESYPSEGPLRALIEAAATELGIAVDSTVLVGAALTLRTPHIDRLLGRQQESSLWSLVKYERNHRKRGMAIAQSKAILYTVAVLDAIGVFQEVDEQFFEKLEIPFVVQRASGPGTAAEDIARLGALDLDRRAHPWIAATLLAWDELLETLEALRGAGFVSLSVGVDRLASAALRVALASFVEALVTHQCRAAQAAARSRPCAPKPPDGLVREIRRHHRIHDADDVRWMAEHWSQIRELVAGAARRGCVEIIGQVAPVLTHFSHVFEGALSEGERLRVRLAAIIQDQPAGVGADVAWFERIEGRGFLLLKEREFAQLEALVADETFAEHSARIRETIRAMVTRNDNARVARDALATLHRLRAHQLSHRERFPEADAEFAMAATEASRSGNESIEIAILLDHVRMLWRSPVHPVSRRAIVDHLSRADALAWSRSSPNRRRLVNIHLLRAELLRDTDRQREALAEVNKAEYFWRDAQTGCRSLVYQQDLLVRIQGLRAELLDQETV
ncbi:hypothetical protein WME89_00885 [Sorangium sp. So ce321]|uniref:hypothetical protein n=1 Tax=Sorangium sp. So ce321 TaxID=3133300 RepID=UPI003F630152